jgi:POT family proton-dependent oligopeptide transporter
MGLTAYHKTRREDTGFFGHPRGLSTLFFTEMWERFSYYGMRSLLILYMVATPANGGPGFPVSKAGAIYGLYTAMVFLLSLPGGWIADKLIGQRKAVLYGGIVIALGHYSMAIPTLATFYVGLVLIVLGTGLLKPNVSTMVGQLYELNDHRRDGGFSLFYMGINLGAFLSPLICGYVGEKINWHYGFGLAGIGMTLGLVQYVVGWRRLGDAGLHPADIENKFANRRTAKRVGWTLLGLIAVIGVLVATGVVNITAQAVSDAGGVVLALATVVSFAGLFGAGHWSPVERKRLLAVVVLFVAAAFFWANYEQAGSTLNLFAERNTRLTLFHFNYPASWFQALNPIFILLLAPVFAWLWGWLGPRDPSSPVKFALGLIFVGLGFAILAPVAGDGRVSAMWLTVTYLVQTIGELLLSPVGLRAMTKLAPARICSFIMGIWFLADSAGNYIGGRLASVYEIFPLPELFGIVAGVTIGLGIIMMLLVRPVERLMSGVQ